MTANVYNFELKFVDKGRCTMVGTRSSYATKAHREALSSHAEFVEFELTLFKIVIGSSDNFFRHFGMRRCIIRLSTN
jgi:hypothetical protein